MSEGPDEQRPESSQLNSDPHDVETELLRGRIGAPDARAAQGGEDTVAVAARALTAVGMEILQPVGTILEDQATRVEHLRSLVRDVDSNYVRVLLVLGGVAALVVAATVVVSDLTDGVMFVLMELLLGVGLLRYVRASVHDLHVRRWVRGITTALLSLLWAVLLVGQIGPEPVWNDANAGSRGDIPLLWVAVWGHVLVAVGLLGHLPLKRYLQPIAKLPIN